MLLILRNRKKVVSGLEKSNPLLADYINLTRKTTNKSCHSVDSRFLIKPQCPQCEESFLC